jgi:hypothetical protein
MPIAVVQTGGPNQITSAGNSWDVTFSSAVTAGNVVVVIARIGTASRTMGTPTGGGGTFASVVSNNATSWGGLAMWSKIEPNSGVTVYNITIASSLNAVGSVTAYELSGADSATATASGTGVQATATTSPRMLDTGIDIPTGGIMIGGISTSPATNVSWGTLADPASFTRTLGVNTGTGQASHFIGFRTASGTAIQGTAITTTARTIYGIAATWIEAPAGGGPFPHFIRRRMFGGMTFPRGGI